MYFALTFAYNHKQDDVEHVLAGRWGYGEDYIRDKVKEIARFIQSYKPTLIVLDPTLFHDDERDRITVDCVNFITEEFRQNPSPDYYDPKSNSCGLKYEFGVAIRHVRVTSLIVVVAPSLTKRSRSVCG